MKEEPIPDYDGSYGCQICTESVRGEKALRCYGSHETAEPTGGRNTPCVHAAGGVVVVDIRLSRSQAEDDGGDGSDRRPAAQVGKLAGPDVAPYEQTRAADQGQRGAGGAVTGVTDCTAHAHGRGLLSPGASMTSRLGDGICSWMARDSARMYVCFVVAASLGVAPRFLVLLACCRAVPQARMAEALDFKALWAPCKDPRNAFPATSPNGALYHVMVLSDQGLSIVGICFAYIAALQLMYPWMGNSRGGRFVSRGYRCCACLYAPHTPTQAWASSHPRATNARARKAEIFAFTACTDSSKVKRSPTRSLLLQPHAWQGAHLVALGSGTCSVD